MMSCKCAITKEFQLITHFRRLSSVIPIGLIAAMLPLAGQAQNSWTDSMSIKGDVRLRYESIDEEGIVGRDRGRFRARLGLTADVNENFKAVIQLATGGDNPTSTNQSFDGGFSRKDIGLDLAYLDWTPNDRTHVYGGKMKNPLHRPGSHALIWDSDLNPEGVAIQYQAGGFFGTAGLLFVEERSTADDSLLLALQGGFEFDLVRGVEVTAGVGYLSYTDTIGNAPFHDGNARGNSVDLNGDLILEYKELELFIDLSANLGAMPVKVFVDFVQNSDANDEDSGLAFGAAIGKADEPGTWQASWAYQDIEADAVIGAFTDSDFGGGGTDSEGHVLKGKYALSDNWALGATYYMNEADAFTGIEHDYKRFQLDLEFKF